MVGKSGITRPLQEVLPNPNPDPPAAVSAPPIDAPPPQTVVTDSSSRPPSPPAGGTKLYSKYYPNKKGRTAKTHASGRRRAVQEQVEEAVDESAVDAPEQKPVEVENKKKGKSEKNKSKKSEKGKGKKQSMKTGEEAKVLSDKVNESQGIDEGGDSSVGVQVVEKVAKGVGAQVGEVVGEEGDKSCDVQVDEQVAKAVDAEVGEVVADEGAKFAGVQVGEQVAKGVGSQVGDIVGEERDKSCDVQVDEQVAKAVNAEVGEVVAGEGAKFAGVQVGEQVAKAVGAQVGEVVVEECDNSVGVQAGEQVAKGVGAQVSEVVGENGDKSAGLQVSEGVAEQVILQHKGPEIIVQEVLKELEVEEKDDADVVFKEAPAQADAAELGQSIDVVGSSTARLLSDVENYHDEGSSAAGGAGETRNVVREGDIVDEGRAKEGAGENVTEGHEAHGTEHNDKGAGIRVASEIEGDGMYLSYKHHAAYRAFEQHKDRGVITCKNVGAFYQSWDLSNESEEVQKMVKAAPFYESCIRSYTAHNRVIISALIERWHPETNSFHLPIGELTITLDDILEILGLPVVGEPMVGNLPSELEDLTKYVSDLLGVGVDEVEVQMCITGGKRLRFDWLKTMLQGREGQPITGTNKKVTGEQVARGYLMTLLGSTIFSDKTGVMVSMKYLIYLADLTKLGDWSWGSATLARLYRYLGSASRWDCKQVGGYLTLLEAWAYEHIPILQPKNFKKFEIGMHRLEQWVPKSRFYEEDEDDILFAKRCQLNNLGFEDVIWMPFRSVPSKPHEIVWFTGVIADDFFTEAYNPERVMRQFGYIQTKPPRPYEPKKCARSFNPRKYDVEYSHTREYFVRYESHVVCDAARGEQVSASNLSECTNEYKEWYKNAKGILNIPHQPKPAQQGAGEETKLKAVLDYLANLKTKVNSITKNELATKIADALALGGYVEGGDGASTKRQRTRGRQEDTQEAGRSKKQRKVQFVEGAEDPEEEVEEIQLVRKKSGKDSGKKKQPDSRARNKKK